MKKLVSSILLLALVAFVILYAAGSFSGERIEPGKLAPGAVETPPAATSQAEQAVVPIFEEAVGTVASRRRMQVAAQVTARILEVKADVGDRVEEGEELVVLDARELSARLAQAREGLAAAQAARNQALQAKARGEARLTQARKRHDRIARLLEGNAATPQQMESAEADYLQAQAGVADAEAAIAAAEAGIQRAKKVVAEAEVAFGYARIQAHLHGVVEGKLVEPGELAWPGRPLLSLLDPSSLRLEALVREGLIGRVRKGDSLEVEIPAAGKRIKGTVAEIIPAADPLSRTFQVRVDFEALPGIHPGMFGRLRVPVGRRKVVRVSNKSVTRVGQLETVVVQDAAGWMRRYVTTGTLFPDGTVEVLSGLKGGERVGLADGDR